MERVDMENVRENQPTVTRSRYYCVNISIIILLFIPFILYTFNYYYQHNTHI